MALAGVADRVVPADPGLLAGLTGSMLNGRAGAEGPGDGATVPGGAVDSAAARIAESLEPPADVHASGDYRRRLARVLTARALREACARAAGAP